MVIHHRNVCAVILENPRGAEISGSITHPPCNITTDHMSLELKAAHVSDVLQYITAA